MISNLAHELAHLICTCKCCRSHVDAVLLWNTTYVCACADYPHPKLQSSSGSSSDRGVVTLLPHGPATATTDMIAAAVLCVLAGALGTGEPALVRPSVCTTGTSDPLCRLAPHAGVLVYKHTVQGSVRHHTRVIHAPMLPGNRATALDRFVSGLRPAVRTSERTSKHVIATLGSSRIFPHTWKRMGDGPATHQPSRLIQPGLQSPPLCVCLLLHP